MRTTLTLDPDVASLVRQTLEHERMSLKEVINDGLRRGLRPRESKAGIQVIAHASALQPGLDPRGFNQLAEELEDEGSVARWAGTGR